MMISRKLFITTFIIAILGMYQLDTRITGNADLDDFLEDLADDLGLKIIDVHIHADYVAIEAICPNQMDWHLQIPKWFVFRLPEEDYQETDPDRVIEEIAMEQEVSKCPICFELCDDKDKVPLITPCKHTFCIECSKRVFAEHPQPENLPNCPLCRKEVSGEEFQKMLSDSTSKL